MLYILIILMYTTSSTSHLKQWIPNNQGWMQPGSFFPSEWSWFYNSCMTKNENARNLHQPAVSDSSALCTGACAPACFWVVSFLFGASCRESRFSRRCFASRDSATSSALSKQTSWRFDATLSYFSMLPGEEWVRAEEKPNTYFTKKDNLWLWKKTKCKLHRPGEASAGLFLDGGGGRSTGSGLSVGEKEREMEADRGIKSDSAALSPGSLCWLSSSKQIETNRICQSCLQ